MNGEGFPAFTPLVDCLKSTEGELMLDLACSRRIAADTLSAPQALAERAGEKQVGAVLTGVSVDVYRVLKLSKLAHRFTFLA